MANANFTHISVRWDTAAEARLLAAELTILNQGKVAINEVVAMGLQAVRADVEQRKTTQS